MQVYIITLGNNEFAMLSQKGNCGLPVPLEDSKKIWNISIISEYNARITFIIHSDFQNGNYILLKMLENTCMFNFLFMILK